VSGGEEAGVAVQVPCFDEEEGIVATVRSLDAALRSGWPGEWEVVVVDDGSRDASARLIADLAATLSSVRVLRHQRNRGYGAALKTGLRHGEADLVAIVDADGTYPVERVGELLDLVVEADMVVAARAPDDVHYPRARRLPKAFLRAWVSWLAAERIPDINSGFRVFRRAVALRFLGVLPDGFSFTTTLTLAMLRSGYRVSWLDIASAPRRGRSKIRPLRDTLRFLHLVLRTGTYFAPLRMLGPACSTTSPTRRSSSSPSH
jgi:glycosyltransferase involved in cell wall biosynthesis